MVEIDGVKRPKIIGMTIARGGSTRLPNKNARMFCGRPLLAWTVVQAMHSLSIDEYWVTTDDEGNAEIARRLGAKVHMREKEGDDVPGYVPYIKLMDQVCQPDDVVVTLFATSPLRKPDDIDRAVKKYLCSPDRERKFLTSLEPIHEDYRFEILNDDLAEFIPETHGVTARCSGLISICTAAYYKEMVPAQKMPYYIPYLIEPWQAPETDTYEQFRFAEWAFYDNILMNGFYPYEDYRKGGVWKTR